MYGFGSKKQLLEDFASTTLTNFTVVVINGYLPAVNLKQVRSCLPNIILCSTLQIVCTALLLFKCFEILSMSHEIMKCIEVPIHVEKATIHDAWICDAKLIMQV